MPSTPSSCLSSTNPLPPRVAGISYGVFFQDTIGATQSINVPPNYLMWMSNNVPPAQDVGSAGDWYIMTTSDSMVVYQKSNVWTAYTTLTGGIPVSLTGIYTTLTSLQNQINSIVAGSGTVTSVSSGGLANFATVSVSNPSSTPALSFSLVAPSVGYVWAGGIPTGGPNYYSLSAVMDSNYGATRGSIAYRGASGWTTLSPGLSGYVLSSQGSGNDPYWASVSGVGTVTSITAGAGLTGGTITTSGTIAVSTTQNITNLSNLTSNGFVVVTGGAGILGAIGQTGSGIVVCQTGPALNGTPTAPTAVYGTNTVQIATTAFVQSALPSVTSPLSQTSGVISIPVATTSVSGYLSSTDWTAFHGKEPGLGNPSVTGYVLSSTTGGVRSWIATAGGGGTVTSVTAGAGLSGGTFTTSGTISLPTTGVAAGSYGLSASIPLFDVDAYGRLTYATTIGISCNTPLFNSGGTSLNILQSSTSTSGYLSSSDWNTFNNKQAAGNYITAATGDVTATGPSGGGSAAFTMATVNSNVGSFTSANITVDAKGRITAASNGSGGSSNVMTVFNVKNYGALGNAVVGTFGSGGANPTTGDTVPIQAAFTAAATAGYGGIVYFPPGVYRVTSAITLPALSTGSYVVVGSGQNASTIFPDAGGGAVTFDIFDSSMTGGIGRNGTSFRDFSINSGGVHATAGYCFNIPYLLHEIRNVFIYEMFNFMATTNVIDTHIESNQLYGCLGTLITLNGTGVLGYFYVEDNSFQCDGAACAFYLAASSSNSFVVKNNDFEGFYTGIVMGSGAAISDSIFDGNTWDEDIINNTGPYYDFSSGSVSKTKIRNEWIVSFAHAVSIGSRCTNVTVEGCDIDANITSDAVHVAGGTGIKVQNNDLAAGAGAAVHITSGSLNMVTVSGNRCGGSGTGILIDSGAGKWFVSGNDCSSATTPLTNSGGANSTGTRYVGQNMGVDL